jgi:hypothetical protein
VAKELTAFLKRHGMLEKRTLTTDVWLGYLLGGEARDAGKLRLEAKEAPSGTIFVSDRQHGPGPAFRMKPEELIDLGFERIFTFGTSPIFSNPLYEVFQKRKAANADSAAAASAGSVKFSETSHWK